MNAFPVFVVIMAFAIIQWGHTFVSVKPDIMAQGVSLISMNVVLIHAITKELVLTTQDLTAAFVHMVSPATLATRN